MVILKFEEKITASKEERLFEIVIVSIKKILPKTKSEMPFYLLPFINLELIVYLFFLDRFTR